MVKTRWSLPAYTVGVDVSLNGVGTLVEVGDPPRLTPLYPMADGVLCFATYSTQADGVGIGVRDLQLQWVGGRWMVYDYRGYTEPPYPDLLPPAPPNTPSESYATAGLRARYASASGVGLAMLCCYGSWKQGASGPWYDVCLQADVKVEGSISFGSVAVWADGGQYRFRGMRQIRCAVAGYQSVNTVAIDSDTLNDVQIVEAVFPYPLDGSAGCIAVVRLGSYPWRTLPLGLSSAWCDTGQPAGFDFSVATNPEPPPPWGAGQYTAGYRSLDLDVGPFGEGTAPGTNLIGCAGGPGIRVVYCGDGPTIIRGDECPQCHNNCPSVGSLTKG